MSTQNITLSLPEDTLLKAKLLAVRRGTSLSRMLAGELERLVSEDEAYERACQSEPQRLEHPFELTCSSWPTPNVALLSGSSVPAN